MFDGVSATEVDFTPYHDGVSRSSQVPPELREFIAWDGEGQNLKGNRGPQSYILFGCSTGDRIIQRTHIHTFDLLDFIVGVGEKHPAAFHVGFSFNYDANMIVQSLSVKNLEKLHETGALSLNRPDGTRYYIHFLPGKWFSVTRFKFGYDRKRNPHAKTTVKIYDLFSFFAKSFIKAYEELVGPVPLEIKEGKHYRNDFASFSLDYIEKYWRIEIDMLRVLAEELRKRLYGAGLRITQWHGPGALASYELRQRGMQTHMGICPEPVRSAARYAYAGGRFEMFRLGRILGPIYSVDINSAYPFGITRLPSLAGGKWKHVISPKRISRFGVYHVRLLPTEGSTFLERAPGPLFHRDHSGNISFPWVLEGWYWSPEVMNLRRITPDRYEIIEGWELTPATRERPFAWVQEVYDTRRKWKKAKLAAQLALKLLMNSLYGKMAQRVGWNEKLRRAPTWHQLEWAGWVTSHCRAMLWDLMSRMRRDSIIAVETDGLYTTTDPSTLGIVDSGNLGEWEVKVYDEILYVQSGMAWLRKGECEDTDCIHQDEYGDMVDGCAWTCKRRGLDVKTFRLSDCQDYLSRLDAHQDWPVFVGKTTRFIGLGSAIQSKVPTKLRHCKWETVDRDIRPGHGGKRVHVHKQCQACADGFSAYDAAHEMSIRSLAYLAPLSSPHVIPWEGEQLDYDWMQDAETVKGDVSWDHAMSR